jgi:hypothetical protein
VLARAALAAPPALSVRAVQERVDLGRAVDDSGVVRGRRRRGHSDLGEGSCDPHDAAQRPAAGREWLPSESALRTGESWPAYPVRIELEQ